MKLRWVRYAGHVARMAGKGRLYSIVAGKSQGKRPLGRQIRPCKDNNRTDLREVCVLDENWIHLDHDKIQLRTFVTVMMNLEVL